jgi:hypothetical protein
MTTVGVTAGQLTVERAMVATLEQWLPFYVVAAARRYAAEDGSPIASEEMETLLHNYAFPFRPRSMNVAKSFEDWLVDALPHVQVLSPTWSPAPGSQDGLAINCQIQIACLAGAQDRDDTRLIRACYEDAIFGVVKQQQGLGGVATGVTVRGGGGMLFTEVSEGDSRTFQGSIVECDVEVEKVLAPFEGPTEVLPDEEGVPPPWPDDPTLEEDGAEAVVVPEPLA